MSVDVLPNAVQKAVGIDGLWKTVQKTAGILILFGAWELLPRIGVIKANFLPPFSQVLSTLSTLVITGELTRHILVSLQRALVGFGLALAINIPLGLAIGWYKGVERSVDPVLQVFRQTSGLALFPLFILFFGIGEVSKVAIIAYACQWPILLNTVSGVKDVDPLLIKSARSMGASNFELFTKIVLPSAIPSIATGVRLGASTAVVLLVAAEMIGASAGLGFLVLDTQYKFEVPKMYAAIISIALLGLATNYIFVWLERRMTAWKEQVHA